MMSTKPRSSLAKLASMTATADIIASTLNATVVLFPHIALLALLGASGFWWGALAGLLVLLIGARRERSRLAGELLAAMAITPTKQQPPTAEDKTP